MPLCRCPAVLVPAEVPPVPPSNRGAPSACNPLPRWPARALHPTQVPRVARVSSACRSRCRTGGPKKLVTHTHHRSQRTLCAKLCTACGQLRVIRCITAHRRFHPQRPLRRPTGMHTMRTRRRHGWPAARRSYPQTAQHLLLLLVSLNEILLEEACWGQPNHTASGAGDVPACQPDRLAFKLEPKALRWFIDSRFGRRRASHTEAPCDFPRNR